MANVVEANKKPFLWNEIDLIKQVGNIIEVYNKLAYKDQPGKQIQYSAAYPNYVFDTTGSATAVNRPTKLVCYDVVRKENGSISENAGSKTHPRPVLMETTDVIINEGKEDEKTVKQSIYRKIYDITFRFDCLAPTDIESLQLTREFEKMMEIHSRYLELGCHRFMYVGRKATYYNRDIHYKSRACEFFAQVEEQWYSHEDRIEQINVELYHLTNIDIERILNGEI
jgi:hypothetical protein